MQTSLWHFALNQVSISVEYQGSVSAALGCVAALYVLTNIVPIRDVYTSIEWPVIVLLGSMIPIGGALQSTGGTALIAGGITGMLGLGVPEIMGLGYDTVSAAMRSVMLRALRY